MADHTGGMVALVPADPKPLVVDGGDPADQLHLTLAYLGDDVTAWTPEQTRAVLDAAAKIAAGVGAPIEARAMGHTTFNPDGGDDGTKEPCAVYTIGDSDRIVPLQADVVTAITDAVPDLPPQHTPFLPHVTAGYQLDASALTYAGPVVFDRLRVALANDVTDYPLGSPEPSQEGAMAAAAPTIEAPETGAPPEVIGEQDGELLVNFPLIVIEGYPTGDGRFIDVDALTARGLPLTVLVQTKKQHGGEEPPAAVTVGRIDTIERVPGPEVISTITGQPFPEGTFVWRGTGAISTTKEVDGDNIADFVKRGFLRGVSADLLPTDYTVAGDEGFEAGEGQYQARVHKGDFGGLTICPVPAFGDCHLTVAGQDVTVPADLPEALAASAFPSWRAAEIGDPVPLLASADPWPAGVPADAVDQLTAVIEDDGGEQRDAPALAQAIVDYMAAQWASGDTDTDMPEDPPTDSEGVMAAGDTPSPDPMPGEEEPTEAGDPAAPQPCMLGPEPATHSLISADESQFAPVCDEHDQEVRDAIEADGGEIGGVVQIEPATDDEEIVP